MWKNCAVHRPSNLVMQALWMAVPPLDGCAVCASALRLGSEAAAINQRSPRIFISAESSGPLRGPAESNSRAALLLRAPIFKAASYVLTYTQPLVRPLQHKALTRGAIGSPQRPPTPAAVKGSWGRCLLGGWRTDGAPTGPKFILNTGSDRWLLNALFKLFISDLHRQS